jgi:hypothetical protein
MELLSSGPRRRRFHFLFPSIIITFLVFVLGFRS